MVNIEYPGGLYEFTEKNKGFFIAAFTDEYIVDRTENISKYMLDEKKGKLLEIRVFNADAEYKLFRNDIGSGFSERVLMDNDAVDYYDEIQYLDIDDGVVLADDMVQATGGGRYHLPMERKKNARVRIRYYFDKYETTGQARVSDWRVVDFVEGK